MLLSAKKRPAPSVTRAPIVPAEHSPALPVETPIGVGRGKRSVGLSEVSVSPPPPFPFPWPGLSGFLPGLTPSPREEIGPVTLSSTGIPASDAGTWIARLARITISAAPESSRPTPVPTTLPRSSSLSELPSWTWIARCNPGADPAGPLVASAAAISSASSATALATRTLCVAATLPGASLRLSIVRNVTVLAGPGAIASMAERRRMLRSR